MANVALIFSGQYVKFVSNLRSGLPIGTDMWGMRSVSNILIHFKPSACSLGHSLKLLMAAVVAGGAVVMGLMGYMQTQVLTDPLCVDANKEAKRKKTKTKMTMKESAKFLASSPYIKDLVRIHSLYKHIFKS